MLPPHQPRVFARLAHWHWWGEERCSHASINTVIRNELPEAPKFVISLILRKKLIFQVSLPLFSALDQKQHFFFITDFFYVISKTIHCCCNNLIILSRCKQMKHRYKVNINCLIHHGFQTPCRVHALTNTTADHYNLRLKRKKRQTSTKEIKTVYSHWVTQQQQLAKSCNCSKNCQREYLESDLHSRT